MSPTAEAVWAVCSDQVPPGAEDRRQIADLLDTLAQQKSAEARAVLLHCLESEVGPMEGRTVAALNVVAAPHRVAPEVMLTTLLPLLLEAARELRPLL